MVEERTTIHRNPDGETIETHTREDGGTGWLIAVLIVLALVVGFFVFTRSASHEAAKDDAVASAAHEVGAAARNVGEAAQTAAEKVDQAADKAADNASDAAASLKEEVR